MQTAFIYRYILRNRRISSMQSSMSLVRSFFTIFIHDVPLKDRFTVKRMLINQVTFFQFIINSIDNNVHVSQRSQSVFHSRSVFQSKLK